MKKREVCLGEGVTGRQGRVVGTVQFWRRQFGADVLAPMRFGANVLAMTRFGADVLSPIRFGAETDWRRCFNADKIWRRDVMARILFSPKALAAKPSGIYLLSVELALKVFFVVLAHMPSKTVIIFSHAYAGQT